MFHEARRRHAALDRDAAFRIDPNDEQAARIEDLLDRLDAVRFASHVRRFVELPTLSLGERLAEIRHRVNEASHLRHERLQRGFGADRHREGSGGEPPGERMREASGRQNRTEQASPSHITSHSASYVPFHCGVA